MTIETPTVETGVTVETEVDEFPDTRTDRELLESIDHRLSVIQSLMEQAVEGIAPVLGDPKTKLMLGMLKGFFK